MKDQGTIEKDGKYYQEAKVVMLTTDKCDNALYLSSNKLTYHKGYLTQDYLKYSLNAKSYHLYIITNEKINEGDWFIGEISSQIYQARSNNKANWNGKKIIATTDSSLTIKKFTSGVFKDLEYQLPRPSKEFIQAYIESYNNGKVIEAVLVELEFINKENPNFEDLGLTQLKLKDNNIIVKKVENTWNDIWNEYSKENTPFDNDKVSFIEWLDTYYNLPIEKQLKLN